MSHSFGATAARPERGDFNCFRDRIGLLGPSTRPPLSGGPIPALRVARAFSSREAGLGDNPMES